MQKANLWLEKAKDIIAAEIFQQPSLARGCHFSYGFPSKSQRLGETWQQEGTEAIFINPCLFQAGNQTQTLGVLIHEMIHIQIGVEKGHKNEFKSAMKVVGLEGKATRTEVGERLADRLNGLNFPPMPIMPLERR